jgi:hypothetical protein
VKKKQRLIDQHCTTWMLLELVQAFLLEETEKQRLKSISSLNLAILKGDFVPKDSINHAELGKEVPLSQNQKIKKT